MNPPGAHGQQDEEIKIQNGNPEVCPQHKADGEDLALTKNSRALTDEQEDTQKMLQKIMVFEQINRQEW